MTNEQILKKAIEKAISNGYKYTSVPFEALGVLLISNGVYPIIFSHSFAKAFWGEEEVKPIDRLVTSSLCDYNWQVHLQKMVIESEPLKYLEKFL